MPKTEIDYSNTIIYKITCKDPTVTDVYVGHTTNFVQRKHAHKQSCINDKTPNYKCKLYEVIRNNGGWVNWKMEIINFFECRDHYEARKKEQEYFISLNATLNSIEPMPKPKPKEIVVKATVIKKTFFCEKCNIHCSSLNVLEKHNETNKHKKINPIQIMDFTNFTDKYACVICDFKTSNKKDYKKHLLTVKHQKMILGEVDEPQTPKFYHCSNCKKIYMTNNGLWKHKKSCNEKKEVLPENVIVQDPSNNDIVHLLIKENSDFKSMLLDMMKSNTDLVKNNTDLQKQMLELCKNNSNTTINTDNSNNSKT